jgi:hypothetical protein
VGWLVVVVAAPAVAVAAIEQVAAPKMPAANALLTAAPRNKGRLIRLIDNLDMIVLLSVGR